jgi:hypothetical protein
MSLVPTDNAGGTDCRCGSRAAEKGVLVARVCLGNTTLLRLERGCESWEGQMSRGLDRDCGWAWRVEFIQPAIPGDDQCVMLYGLYGEIVGPMTTQLAEAWIDHFDNARLLAENWQQRVAYVDN